MRSSLIYGFLLLAVAGCRPSVDSEELGDVIYELPNVPGAEEPYELPNLDEEQEAKTEVKAEATPEIGPEAPDSASLPATVPPSPEQSEKGSSPVPSK